MDREAWADAYFAQALSDWNIYNDFSPRHDVPFSQALHYLQMATEKLAKAYRLRDTATNLQTILTSHVGLSAFFNTFLLSPSMLQEYAGRREQLNNIRRDCRNLARAVEQLAPAVEREAQPANAEYPWDAGDRVITPIHYSFPGLSLLREPRGRQFLKFIERAFVDYQRAHMEQERSG